MSWLALPFICAQWLAVAAPTQLGAASGPTTQRAVVVWRYELECDPGTQRVMLLCTLPRTLPNRQTVKSLHITPDPSSRFVESETEYARFDIRNPAARMQISIEAEIELFRADLATAHAHRPTSQPVRESRIDVWLKPERYIESDHAQIAALARSIPEDPPQDVIRRVMSAVTASLKPAAYAANDRGAVWALTHRAGDCSEFSDLFVALCRAKGIPARAVEGFVVTPVREGDTSAHAWTEAYFPGVGWVPFDPFHTAIGIAKIDELAPTRIVTSLRRNDSNLQGLHNWSYRVWGDPVTIRDHFSVLKLEPLDPADQ